MTTIVVVTGSRKATDALHRPKIRHTLLWASGGSRDKPVPQGIELWDGSAEGADTIARSVAKEDFGWSLRPFAANWSGPCVEGHCPPDKDHRQPRKNGSGYYCPFAGFRRNQRMVDVAVEARDAGQRVICTVFPVWPVGPKDNRGTYDMLTRIFFAGLPFIGVPLPLPEATG